MIDSILLERLACPNCDDRPPLRLVGETLVCDVCGSVYPIVNGIPHLLPESAVAKDKKDAD